MIPELDDFFLDLEFKQRACLEYCPNKGNCEYYHFERDNCPKIKELKKEIIKIILE